MEWWQRCLTRTHNYNWSLFFKNKFLYVCCVVCIVYNVSRHRNIEYTICAFQFLITIKTENNLSIFLFPFIRDFYFYFLFSAFFLFCSSFCAVFNVFLSSINDFIKLALCLCLHLALNLLCARSFSLFFGLFHLIGHYIHFRLCKCLKQDEKSTHTQRNIHEMVIKYEEWKMKYNVETEKCWIQININYMKIIT